MNPLRRPRPWIRLACVVALGFGLWLLLAPRIAMYLVDDNGAPYDVNVKYAWERGTSDEILILPADMFGEIDPAVGDGGADAVVTSVRLNCGNVFTSGEGEAGSPWGARVCSDVERPQLIGGLALGVVGVAGFVLARRLPGREASEHAR